MKNVATTLDKFATATAPWLFFAGAAWNLYNVMKESASYSTRITEGQKTAQALKFSLEDIDKKIYGVRQDLDELEDQIIKKKPSDDGNMGKDKHKNAVTYWSNYYPARSVRRGRRFN
jgi:hypothetical protein